MISYNPEILKSLYYKHSPIPTYIWQKISDPDDFILIDFNNAANYITNGKIEKFRRIRLTQLYAANPEIQKEMYSCFRDQSTFDRELSYKFQTSGETKYLLVKYAYVEPCFILVQTIDRTQHKMAAEALRKSEQRFGSLTELLTAAIFIFQGHKNVYVNTAASEITGYSKEELLSMKFWEVIHPDMRDDIREAGLSNQAKDNISEESDYTRNEVKILRKDGKTRWLLFSNGQIEYNGHSARLGTAFDITDHKKAREEAREKEEQFRQLTELLPASVIIFNENKICYVNAATSQMTGYSKDELLDMNFWDPFHPNMRESMKQTGHQVLEAARNNEPFLPVKQVELSFVRKDGSVRWGYCTIDKIHFNGKPTIISTTIDITETKIAQQELQERNERFRILTEVLPTPIIIFQGTKTVYVNSAASEATGYTKDELLAMNFWDTIAPEMKDDINKRGLNLLERAKNEDHSNIRARRDVKIYCKDGSRIWMACSLGIILFNGKPAVLVSALDISESKRMKDELAIKKEEFQLLYEENPAMYFTVDQAGIILSVNKFGAQQLGYIPTDMMGKSLIEWIHPEDLDTFSHAYHNFIDADEDLLHMELRFVKADGSEISVKQMIRSIVSKAGDAISLIVCEDISQLKQTQRENELLSLKRAETDKLVTLGQFTAAITHEINNPLDVILSLSYLLKNGIEKQINSVELLEFVDKIKQQTHRIHSMAKDILTYVKPHQLKFEVLEIHQILQKIAHQYQDMYRRKLTVQTDFAFDLPYIKGDPMGLELVFRNILQNSIEAFTENGQVTIKTKLAENEHIEIQITDNGIGIDGEKITRIFEPFFTARQNESGTGLGLTICKKIVEQHNGNIFASNVEPSGTRMTILLPPFR
ncbi:PAS domain S-box protein [candidate division KSB1 bacterium]|nr:PAS domain S-box protein [candidate division KSB1 bacterium]